MFEKIKNWWVNLNKPEMCPECGKNEIDSVLGCCEDCFVGEMVENQQRDREEEYRKFKQVVKEVLEELNNEKNNTN